MGPIRGLKRKKKTEKKVDQNVFALGPQPRPSDWWDHFSRRITGPLSENSATFESVFKISRKTFSYICSLVKEEMAAKSGHCVDTNGNTLSLNDQVAVALRRLGSGDSLSIVGESFGVSSSTVSQLTWRFVEAIEERGLHHVAWPSTEAEMDAVKAKFERIRGLPNCCGAIDTTHIVMTLPASDPDGAAWLDREENSSMVLQAVVDPEMRFRSVIDGWPGSLGDRAVLESSGFFRLAQDGRRLNGPAVRLDGAEVREYIVGDRGFPLLPWLMTPYRKRGGLGDAQARFNKRHAATRMVAARALARLKEAWRIIHGVMWKPDRHRLPRIVLACCVLHNIVIDMEDAMLDDMPLSHLHDAAYRQESCEVDDDSAAAARESLALHLAGNQPPSVSALNGCL